MKNRILFSLMALVFAMFLVTTVQASTLSGVDVEKIILKGISVEPSDSVSIAGFAGETVPITVIFNSDTDEIDAKVKTWIGGYRSDISSSTRRIHLVNGSTYSELLTLQLPSDIDQDEEYTLYVRIETKTEYVEEEFSLRIQRESYNVDVLDVDVSRTVEAGGILPATIVLKNIGYEELEDVFVSVKMPELGLEKKGYFFDLTAEDETDECCKQDSGEKIVKLNIPANAKTGSYTLEVTAYNKDSEAKVTKTVLVSSKADSTQVFAPVRSKEVASGATVHYDVIFVNSGSQIVVYEIMPEVSGNLFVTVEEPIITVPAGSSRTVKVAVKAGEDEGTYNFALNINSDGQTVEKVDLITNITGTRMNNTTVLTIVLAVIFVVLLVVLIVLLLRKPEKENIEESYY